MLRAMRSIDQTTSTSNLRRRASSMSCIQCGPACLRSANTMIRVFLHDVKPTLSSELPEIVQLGLEDVGLTVLTRTYTAASLHWFEFSFVALD